MRTVLLFTVSIPIFLNGCYTNPPWSVKARLEAVSAAQAALNKSSSRNKSSDEWLNPLSPVNPYDTVLTSKRRSSSLEQQNTVLGTTFRVNSTVSVPLIPITQTCEGMKLGMYIWEQSHWQSGNTHFARHLTGPNAQRWTCGDIYINVADYSNAESIKDSAMLLPFIINARRAGNRGVIWLTYGDVVERNFAACKAFANTFFKWLSTIPDEWVDVVRPIGLSYDIENFPVGVLREVILDAQERKIKHNFRFGQGGILVQCTVENHEKFAETDIVMRFADRALMMAYRNSLGGSGKEDDGLIERLRWMFTKQCKRCLDDAYATEHYKAKVTVLVETACKLGKSCSYISFCAFDGLGNRGGIEYLGATLKELDRRLISDGILTEAQRNRLFSSTAPFAVHDWDWFRCFYQDEHDSNGRCSSYHSFSATCRAS